MLEEVAFLSFLSFYTAWLGCDFVANRRESGNWPKIFSILHYYSNIAKVTDLFRYRQTVTIAFIEYTSIPIYTLLTLFFPDVFGITWATTYLKQFTA